MAMIKEMVRVQENPYGGALWITTESGEAMIHIAQRYTDVVVGKIELTTRVARMFCDIEEAMKINVGDVMIGDILIKEQQTPLDPDNPELHLHTLDDGTYEKVNGQYVWRIYVYSQDMEEGDEYVVRTTTVNH